MAIELNQGFDETLSRQMQQKILPLMESVDATTKTVVEHIDQMAQTVSSPASDMMQRVVDELKQSMKSLINEFSSGLSGSATTELENLAHQLGSATQAMYNPQIKISAESETKRSIFREKDKTKRSKKESAQHSKSRNKSFVMTSVSAL